MYSCTSAAAIYTIIQCQQTDGQSEENKRGVERGRGSMSECVCVCVCARNT